MERQASRHPTPAIAAHDMLCPIIILSQKHNDNQGGVISRGNRGLESE